MTASKGEILEHVGQLSDGTSWRVRLPSEWNGILVSDADLLDTPASKAYDRWCVANGMAVARTSRDVTQWLVGGALDNRIAVHDHITKLFGRPERVFVTGASLGGLVTRALVERMPDFADGGLAMNGGGAGTIGLWNAKLDALVALKALVDPSSPIDIVGVSDPDAEDGHLATLVDRATSTLAGQARLLLAASLSSQPTWSEPDVPEPSPDDVAAIAPAVARSLRWGVAPQIRAYLESVAGGNFSWNHGVDYSALVTRPGGRLALVELAYERAGLSLAADLDVLDALPRIQADERAVEWAEENSILTGRIGVPMVTLYAIGDPAAVPEEESAYLRTVRSAGSAANLHQLFLHAAGHCEFTPGEMAVSLSCLIASAESARSSSTGNQGSSDDRNHEASRIDESLSAGDATGEAFTPRRPPAFLDYQPAEFTRPYDWHDSPRAPKDRPC